MVRRHVTAARAFVLLLLGVGIGAVLFVSQSLSPDKVKLQVEEALREYVATDFELDGVELGLQAGPEATLEMAQTCSQLGNPEQAKALLRELVRNNHSDELFLHQVGSVMAGLGLEKDPDSLIAEIRSEIVRLNNRGAELAREGRLEEAVVLFEEAVAGMPGNRVVNLNTARVLILHMQRHNALLPGHLHVAVLIVTDHHQLVRAAAQLFTDFLVQSAGPLGQAMISRHENMVKQL